MSVFNIFIYLLKRVKGVNTLLYIYDFVKPGSYRIKMFIIIIIHHLLGGNIENSMEKVANGITKIAEQLKINLESCLERFGENPALNSMAVFLDTKGYDVFGSDEIFDHVSSLAVHFRDIIKANDCDTAKLKPKTEILYEHVKKFL